MLIGVNIDHVATLRQMRGTPYPELIQIVQITEQAGADAITLHLREDRRHIQDKDVFQLKKIITTRMNLEMSINQEIVDIACEIKPDDCCIVPERRQELTTEGGLDVVSQASRINRVVEQLKESGIRVSLFIEPEQEQIEAAAQIGAAVIELHTGTYANHYRKNHYAGELSRIQNAVEHALQSGLIVNAGHGLDYVNVVHIADIQGIAELNIGHSIISRAIFSGMKKAVRDMCQLIKGRSS